MGAAPWRRGGYEVIDYIIIGNMWNNGITDAETHINFNIPDHFPMITQPRFKLKGRHRFNKTTETHAECTT